MTKTPRKKIVAVTEPASATPEDALFSRVVDIIEAARGRVARSVNTALVQAYWLIGREIVEVEQHGKKALAMASTWSRALQSGSRRG